MQILEIKLLEHKALHKQNESKLEGEIDQMSADLEEVKKVLQNKINEFGEDWISMTDEDLILKEDLRSLDGSTFTGSVSSMLVQVGDLAERDCNDSLSEAEN